MQGPPLSSGATVENFNSFSTSSPCPGTIATGTITGTCSVAVADVYGGAASESADPVTTGPGTPYATTSTEMTITLDTPQKYLGFWWSAGNSSNVVEFYENDVLVARMSTLTLENKLDTLSELRSKDGLTVYSRGDYFENPLGVGSNHQDYIFLSLYGQGGTTFDKIVFSGAGFEFDNLTTYANEIEPAGSLVMLDFIPGLVPPDDYHGGGGSPGGSGSGSQHHSLAYTGFDPQPAGWIGGAVIFVGTGLLIARSRRAKSTRSRR